MIFYKKLFFSLSLSFLSFITFAQSTSDIEYLEMLPQGQSSDIASRLNDRSLRDDEPSFNNSTKKI